MNVAPLAALREKGLEWVDQLQTRPLERSLTWLSLKCQKNAQWSYGLSSNYSKPSDLDKTMGSVYFCALPFLGFNRCITTKFRTLPIKYQGIGMKKWSIEKLAKDITTLIRHWQTDSILGRVLQLVYESFQSEVGLDGNILTRSYQRFGDHASHSWFKVLWQYSSLYKVNIEFNPTYLFGRTRHDDKPLIQLLMDYGYKGVALERLNKSGSFTAPTPWPTFSVQMDATSNLPSSPPTPGIASVPSPGSNLPKLILTPGNTPYQSHYLTQSHLQPPSW
jgi:hypothetical protein